MFYHDHYRSNFVFIQEKKIISLVFGCLHETFIQLVFLQEENMWMLGKLVWLMFLEGIWIYLFIYFFQRLVLYQVNILSPNKAR